MKQLVYAEHVNSVEELRVRVKNAYRMIREMPGIFGRKHDHGYVVLVYPLIHFEKFL
jgi:hypothetical protein